MSDQPSSQAIVPASKPKPGRDAKGRILPGASGNPSGLPADAGRVRRQLNLTTMRELQAAFNRGGRKAIDQVMRTQPAIFLKLLVLLVPRELEVTHSAGVKGLTDDQLDRMIEALEGVLAGQAAKLIDGKAVEALPASPLLPKSDVDEPSS